MTARHEPIVQESNDDTAQFHPSRKHTVRRTTEVSLRMVDLRRAGQLGGWVAAVIGLWILVTTVLWFLFRSGPVSWFFWSTIISGIVVLVCSAIAGFSSGRIARRTGGIAAVIGLWILVTTVVWFLVGGDRVGWFFWNTFISGIVVLVLSAFAGVTR